MTVSLRDFGYYGLPLEVRRTMGETDTVSTEESKENAVITVITVTENGTNWHARHSEEQRRGTLEMVSRRHQVPCGLSVITFEKPHSDK